MTFDKGTRNAHYSGRFLHGAYLRQVARGCRGRCKRMVDTSRRLNQIYDPSTLHTRLSSDPKIKVLVAGRTLAHMVR